MALETKQWSRPPSEPSQSPSTYPLLSHHLTVVLDVQILPPNRGLHETTTQRYLKAR